MKLKKKPTGLQALRVRRAQLETEIAGPLIAERDRATSWARVAEAQKNVEERRRKAAERLFMTDLGKFASEEMQHFVAQEIAQHAMRAAVATVNETMETGDYVISIRVPELNIRRHFSRRSVHDAPIRADIGASAQEFSYRHVNIDTSKLRKHP